MLAQSLDFLRRSLALAAATVAIPVLLGACSFVSSQDSDDAPRPALPAASIDIPATDPLRTTPSAAVPQVAAEFELPPGFAAVQWADALEEPIALAFSPDGRLFVAETGGRVWTFLDADGDGRAEEGILFAEVDAGLHSIAVASDRLVYLGGRGHVSVARDRDGDGRADTVAPLVRDLFVGQHASNRIALGPDGRVYITIVSPCDGPCAENNPLSVSILTLHPDSPQLESYASGLHDPHGLAFSPDGALWATDRGFDSPCVTSERLTRVAFGTADGRPDCAQEPGPQRASVSGASALDLGRDAGARGIAWFESDLVPPKLSGGFYIAFAHGDGPAEGAHVRFARLLPDGSLILRDFASGFAEASDVASGPMATVFVADQVRGVVYRIGSPLEG